MKTKTFIIFTLISLLGLITLPSHAKSERIDSIELKFNDEYFQGKNKIKLKKMLRQKYPNYDFDNKQLVSVVLIAKSKHSNATAHLRLDNKHAKPDVILSRPYNFDINDDYSFDRLRLPHPNLNRKGNNEGKWQIYLDGYVKVRKVLVELKQQAMAAKKTKWETAVSLKAQAGQEYHSKIKLNQTIDAIQLIATNGDVRINRMIIKFSNGDKQALHDLEGTLTPTQAKVLNFKNPTAIKAIKLSYESYWNRRNASFDVQIKTHQPKVKVQNYRQYNNADDYHHHTYQNQYIRNYHQDSNQQPWENLEERWYRWDNRY